MQESRKDTVFVVGHIHPDTDSICSAIAYANLKRLTTGDDYAAMRAGVLNEETKYVLERFGVAEPPYLPSVRPRVKDLDIQKIPGIESSESLKHAWELMHRENAHAIAALENGKVHGILSLTDIAQSYLGFYDATLLAKARTSFQSIAETLDGEIVCESDRVLFDRGKVTVAASSPESMEELIEGDDLVLLGNRYETQLCALELGASCLILSQGARPSRTISKLARDRGCMIICTAFDTYNAVRLLNQSIPAQYFMTKEGIITFQLTDLIEDVRTTMSRKRYSSFPVVDKNGQYQGLLSGQQMMSIRKQKMILVDHNEITQAVDGIEYAEILEIIDHHRLGGLRTMQPVYFRNQPVGCTATIIANLYDEVRVSLDEAMAGLLFPIR